MSTTAGRSPATLDLLDRLDRLVEVLLDGRRKRREMGGEAFVFGLGPRHRDVVRDHAGLAGRPFGGRGTRAGLSPQNSHPDRSPLLEPPCEVRVIGDESPRS